MQRAQSMTRSLLAGCAVLVAGTCSRQVQLGDIRDTGNNGDAGDGGANISSILWSATFEVGDLSEWSGDGQGGAYLDRAPIAPAATLTVAHRGRYAGMATATPGSGTASINYLFRNQPSVPAAYYSAWFYIPSSFTVNSWLSLIHFNSSISGDGKNLSPTWDLNLYPRADGSLVAHLYDFVTQTNLEQASPAPVPIATWVHFEVFLRKAADATGEVAVWQDGVSILDRRNVATVATDWVQWAAGAASDNVTPPTAVVYVDDAAISLSRLGTSDWTQR
jgi:hypothetical protein